MIWTVFGVAVARLFRNRAELVLTFIVPIAFFSIFAVIFGNGVGRAKDSQIDTLVVDTVKSSESTQFAKTLREIDELKHFRLTGDGQSLSMDQARELVRRGRVAVVVIIKQVEEKLALDLLVDSSDQISGQLAKAVIAPAIVMQSELKTLASLQQASEGEQADEISVSRDDIDLIQTVDVLGAGKTNPMISMYAAGIAVMFLLFGATSGGGSLLEEHESRTLERLMSTRLTMDQLLLGKWLYQTMIGMLQVTTMFIWGWLVFKIDLWGHFDGFLVMAIVTTGAAASFGLLLATLSRTRGQLNGLSVILVLTMSALGGSMVPRYLMSDRLQEWGMFTFNAWALDGFDKVFWRELPMSQLWPQVCVLMLCSATMLVIARFLATRWETA